MNDLLSKIQIPALFTLTLLIASCSKNVDIPETVCTAGKGGDITLILQPEHHGEPIVSTIDYPDSAFIKFNATEFPGENPSLYDLVVVGDLGKAEIWINDMKCGNYFIYMTGKDQSIDDRVRGGIPVKVDLNSGIKIIKVPITED